MKYCSITWRQIPRYGMKPKPETWAMIYTDEQSDEDIERALMEQLKRRSYDSRPVKKESDHVWSIGSSKVKIISIKR